MKLISAQRSCRTSICLGSLLALASLALHAQANPAAGSQDFRVGGISVSIPPPAAGLVEVGSDDRVIFEALVPDSNRLIAAFVTSDNKASLHGSAKNLDRYALVETMRSAEFIDVDAAGFKQLVAELSQQMGNIVNSSKSEMEAELNRKLKALNSNAATVALDKPLQLGTLFSKEDAYAFGMMMPYTINGATTNMVMGASVLRVHNRLLFAYYYLVYKDQATALSVRKTTEDWTDAILAANKQ